jgi:hypothetical protein
MSKINYSENLEKIKDIFENSSMYRKEIESFMKRYPLNETCLIARINQSTLKVEIFYLGNVLERSKITKNTRIKIIEVVDANTGKSKKNMNPGSVLELMPNNIDKPWIYAYINTENLIKVLKPSSGVKRSTSSSSYFTSEPIPISNKAQKTVTFETESLSGSIDENDDLSFNPNVFDEDSINSNNTETGGKRKKKKSTKKRKSGKKQTLKKRKNKKH